MSANTGTDQNGPSSPTVRQAEMASHRGCGRSLAPLIKRRRWGGEAVAASDRGGRICLPPKESGAVISADTVGGNGRRPNTRHLPAVLAFSWAAAAPPAAASTVLCEADNVTIHESHELAKSAWEAADLTGFGDAHQQALEALACLHEPIQPAQAAELYTLEATAVFMERDKLGPAARERAQGAFMAALQVQPDYTPGPGFVFPGGELHTWYQQALELHTFPNRQAELGPSPRYHCPVDARLLLDGVTPLAPPCGTGWPTGRPVVVQVVDDSERVRWSGLNPVGVTRLPVAAFDADTRPSWPSPQPATADEWSALTHALVPNPARPWWWASGGALLASGGLYSAALLSSRQWERSVEDCAVHGACWDGPAAAYEHSEQLRRRSNALSIGALGAGGIGVGMGLVALNFQLRPRCR